MTGTVELLGQRLQAGGDLGELLHAVLALLGRAVRELEVVDHEDIEALLALEAPGARGELGDGDAAGLVDVEGDALHLAGGVGDARRNPCSLISPRRIL